MFSKFIDRPVLSTVISIIIVILGVLGLISLPVSQYPEIAPPTVTVSANYQGASAEVVMSSVVIPLEEQINGVEDMTYMTSTSNNDGSAAINIYFKLGTNPDLAAVNVQNRVSRATPLLPQEVTRAGVTTSKRQSDNILILSLYSDNPDYDDTFLQNYANINILPKIKRVAGVGEAMIFGQKDYSMRIWLKPDVMGAYGLVPSDITALLAEQNIECNFLGARTPIEAITSMVSRSAPPAIFLWAQLPKNGDPKYFRDIPSIRPAPRFILGGPGWDRQECDEVAFADDLTLACQEIKQAIGA